MKYLTTYSNLFAILQLVAVPWTTSAFSSTTSSNRVAFSGLQDQQFRHPLDRDLTSLIKLTPGINLAEQAFRRAFPLLEEGTKLDLLASSVKVSEKQLPELDTLLKEACRVLEIDTPPELYVQSNTQANAYTTAFSKGKTPIVVVTSALVDRCTPQELQSILGHELGHLKCEHSFYLTLGGLATAPLRVALPFGIGGNVADSVLQDWRLAAEYSCDRAALLVAQDVQVVTSAMLKLFAGTSSAEINAEAFVEQAKEYETLLQTANPAIRASIQNQARTHPLPVRRVAELKRWFQSNQYENLVKKQGVAL